MTLEPKQVIEMQKAIEQIHGVHSSKLILNEEGVIGECHVLASGGRHPKQISKDVQSVLAATFEYRIDHRIISVAQLESDSMAHIVPRIVYKSVDVVKQGQMMTATVNCTFKDMDYKGEFSGVATKNGDFRVVAEAVLEAVRCQLKDDEHIVLEGYRVQDVGWLTLANVVVTFVRGDKEYPLVGTAIVGNHAHDAYVKAVFDALNRVLFVS